MLPWSADLAGRIDRHVIASEVLRGNPLGDPHERPLWVQLPPGYDDDPGRRYPSVYVLQGYTGHLTMWANRSAYSQPFPELADAIFASGQAPPAIVVYVDAWTAYGGSQFVDSPGTGRYHTYLCDEVVPWVDDRYRTLASRDHRAVSGKSQRRLRCDDHADAAARSVRSACNACWRLVVRDELHPRSRRGGTALARLRRGHHALVGRFPLPPKRAEGRGHRSAHAAWRFRLLLGSRRWRARTPDGTRDGRAAPGGLAALAGLGSGPDGAGVTRTHCDHCARSGSTQAPETSSSSTWVRRRSGRHWPMSACVTTLFTSSCSTASMAVLATGIRWHSPGSASG